MSVVVSWKAAVTPADSKGMAGELDPTGAICGPYGEGVGTVVCVGHWFLLPGGGEVMKARNILVEKNDGPPVRGEGGWISKNSKIRSEVVL